MGEQKIDFVMLWVDGNDPEWQKEKNKYSPLLTEENASENGDCRFRDWDNLQYWFRGVEKYADWVNKVYFVTNGQKPKWLNPDAEKLVLVKHSDYIRADALPTFNSHAIELNLHRIRGLSDHFVYFNDDTFITDRLSKELFFVDDLPVHPAELRPVIVNRDDSLLLAHVYMNMMHIINRHFSMRENLRANRAKWFSPGSCSLKPVLLNMMLSQYRAFPGFRSYHLPVPVRKQTMEAVWEQEYDILNATTMHKFRTSEDVSQFLFRYWDLASGRFEPIKGSSLGRYYGLDETTDSLIAEACSAIEQSRHRMVCINDCYTAYDRFEEAKRRINGALEKLLPEKSSFEL